ncbi:MAG: hypothetical protein ACJ718_07145, partial [Nitrososphaeraceae archaeon]
MTDQFAFLRDKKRNAAAITVAAISLGVLLLLPASLGIGGTIVQEAFAQFNLPLLEDQGTATGGTDEGDGDLTTEGDTGTTTPPPDTTTTPPTTTGPPTAATTANTAQQQDLSTYMMASRNTDAIRGLIGSTLPAQGASGALTATDGSGGGGHVTTGRFRLFANDTSIERFITKMYVSAIDGSSFHNITITEGAPHRFEVTAGNATTGTGSNIAGSVFVDGSITPVKDNVPIRLSVRGSTKA